MGRFRNFAAIMRSPKAGDRCLAPSTTRLALSRGIPALRAAGAAAGVASLISIKQNSSSLRFPLLTFSNTANRNRPSELHPFIQYAESRISMVESLALDFSEVTRRWMLSASNNSFIADISDRANGQN